MRLIGSCSLAVSDCVTVILRLDKVTFRCVPRGSLSGLTGRVESTERCSASYGLLTYLSQMRRVRLPVFELASSVGKLTCASFSSSFFFRNAMMSVVSFSALYCWLVSSSFARASLRAASRYSSREFSVTSSRASHRAALALALSLSHSLSVLEFALLSFFTFLDRQDWHEEILNSTGKRKQVRKVCCNYSTSESQSHSLGGKM